MGQLRDGVWQKARGQPPRWRVPAPGQRLPQLDHRRRRAGPGGARGFRPRAGATSLRLLRLPVGAPHADLPRAQGPRGAYPSTWCIRSSARTAGPSTPASPARPATGSAAALPARRLPRRRPGATSRVTVPVLWDKATGTIVSNKSAEIIRMLNTAFDGIAGNTLDFSPAGAARRDRRSQRPRLRRGQQRRLPCRLRPTQAAYDERRPTSSPPSTGSKRGSRTGAGWSATG